MARRRCHGAQCRGGGVWQSVAMALARKKGGRGGAVMVVGEDGSIIEMEEEEMGAEAWPRWLSGAARRSRRGTVRWVSSWWCGGWWWLGMANW